MSELDVIVIRIRAEQAAEHERLIAEREYQARGTFRNARISRARFGTDDPNNGDRATQRERQ